ncbi:sugar phosphate isomerase [Marispirochaeta sp.]|uniref:sugar phosphate isomerase n=1 Tax=Marispirochaeta sp. TaxID=2038653 RepID=UPI0029C7DF15|nr:sugar phosphate isomerase [Marispirochaeta sp.]
MDRKSEYIAFTNDTEVRRLAADEATRFLKEETQFQLGHLPTEQPHPYTEHFSTVVSQDAAEGVELLLQVDADIPAVARRTLLSPAYAHLVETIGTAVDGDRKICFSGCGSTGRLAMMLEEMWRQYWEDRAGAAPGEAARRGAAADSVLRKANQAVSIMTGGDRALIRAVENFEDFAGCGERQVADLGLESGDILIAITEGGETSSVIGTAEEGLRRGCEVFFVFNNPAGILTESVERSRRIIADPRVTVLDLFTGSMSLTGSTRMQATTMEMLVVGAALEEAFVRNEGKDVDTAYRLAQANCFAVLLHDLKTDTNLAAMGRLAQREADIYSRGGRITYLASRFLLDVFSDTTERSPTFMLPPFRPSDDTAAPDSWAFAKDPDRPSSQAWFDMLRRKPRGIDWTGEDYRNMGTSGNLELAPPSLGEEEIARYVIGNEPDASRSAVDPYLFLSITVGEAETAASDSAVLQIGPQRPAGNEVYHISLEFPESQILLWQHLAVKLVMNTVSTASMGIMGRIRGNWMVQLDPTNKKLIDRGSRIISHLSGIGYDEACYELHRSILARERFIAGGGQSTTSPVVDALDRLGVEG